MIDLELLRRGDPAYIRTLVELHGSLVMSIAHQYASGADEAEDLYQEVWVHVFRKRARFEGTGSFGGWINRVANRVCVQWVRHRQVRERARKRYGDEGMGKDQAWTPVDTMARTEQGEFFAKLRKAIAELPGRQAQAFLLTRVEEYSAVEAATLLGVEPSAVRASVHRAVMRLREAMEDPRDEMS